MKPATTLTALFLAMVAAAHLLRLLLGVEVTVGGISIPWWVSVIACVLPVGLAIGLWWESRKA
jgi:hypothetical protein